MITIIALVLLHPPPRSDVPLLPTASYPLLGRSSLHLVTNNTENMVPFKYSLFLSLTVQTCICIMLCLIVFLFVIHKLTSAFLFGIGRFIRNLLVQLAREICMRQSCWNNLLILMLPKNVLHVWTCNSTRWTNSTRQRRKSSWTEGNLWRNRWRFSLNSILLSSKHGTKELLPRTPRTILLYHAPSYAVYD